MTCVSGCGAVAEVVEQRENSTMAPAAPAAHRRRRSRPLACRVERKFSDKDICKYYLCGFCPYE